MEAPSRQIIIAGAGIAGLTAALAFAHRGFSVQIFERAAGLAEVGAGLQISPNATRILDMLGVLPALRAVAVRPEAVVLRNGATLAETARVPLGEYAELRWRAPYLVAHRADLQAALLAEAGRHPDIRLTMNAPIRDVAVHARGVTVAFERDDRPGEATGLLLVGADGVWSTVRPLAGGGRSRYSGRLAWRSMLRTDSEAGRAFAPIAPADRVTAFMDPAIHLVAYPVRGGASLNLVAVTAGEGLGQGWSQTADPAILKQALAVTAPEVSRLADDASPWQAWPLHQVDPAQRWTDGRTIALIGDAAHAMTPFAAQGAAMGIEDAAVLADCVAKSPGDTARALAAYEAQRKPRVRKVVRRGAFNHFTWHASGPVASARDMVLKILPATKLARDLDWLYGWKAPGS